MMTQTKMKKKMRILTINIDRWSKVGSLDARNVPCGSLDGSIPSSLFDIDIDNDSKGYCPDIV